VKLDEGYRRFQERGEDGVWTSRVLKTADHMLLVNSATIAKKKTGVIVQEAGFREAKAGLERCPSGMTNMETSEAIDDSDDSEWDGGGCGWKAIPSSVY